MLKLEEIGYDCQLCRCHWFAWKRSLSFKIAKPQRNLSDRKSLWKLARLQRLRHCSCQNSLNLQWWGCDPFPKDQSSTDVTIFESFSFWSDWKEKTVVKAVKVWRRVKEKTLGSYDRIIESSAKDSLYKRISKINVREDGWIEGEKIKIEKPLKI